MKQYLINMLISLDQFVNTATGGDPDETVSSRMGKWNREKVGGWRQKVSYGLCLMLNKLDKDHCEESIEEDEGADAVDNIQDQIDKVQAMYDCDFKQRELTRLNNIKYGNKP